MTMQESNHMKGSFLIKISKVANPMRSLENVIQEKKIIFESS